MHSLSEYPSSTGHYTTVQTDTQRKVCGEMSRTFHVM